MGVVMLSSLWISSVIKWFSLKIIDTIKNEWWYSFVLLCVLSGLVFTRCPYVYGYLGFVFILFILIIPLYLSLVLSRLDSSITDFLASMIPSGSPSWILPFIPHIEIVSFVIRPVVVLIRPFINISVGVYVGLAIGNLCFSSSGVVSVVLLALFVYEVFVVFVHWFIVQEILKFSVFH
uniref:ATP synthase F0 subunit 6 n=1 Tax=Schistosoma margrebowiei TaxID=48269 RepID=A0A1E1GJA1_9TREM|nr:ATP synthase F0 subunit 6 [Schistosoma margrebowiei]